MFDDYLGPELTLTCAFTVRGFAPGFGLALVKDSKIAVRQIKKVILMLMPNLTECYYDSNAYPY